MNASRMEDVYERERDAVSNRLWCASRADSQTNRSLGWMLRHAKAFEMRLLCSPFHLVSCAAHAELEAKLMDVVFLARLGLDSVGPR